MNPEFTIKPAYLSAPGRRRGANEDFAIQCIPSDVHTLSNKGALFAVADGLGGHNAEQVASRLALQTLVSTYYRASYDDLPWSLERAMQAANDAVWNQAMRVREYGGMGTTLVAVVVRGNRIFVANVGDSRAYLMRGRRLWQITRDHSYAAEMSALGTLSRAQIRRHPWRKVLSRALGRKSTVRIDLFQGALVPGDVFFLCTDGLSDFVDDRQMLNVLARTRDPMDSARALATLAYRQGSDDNITGLAVHLAPARQTYASVMATRTTIPLPRGAAQVHRGGAVVASRGSDFLYLLSLALGFGSITWAMYMAMLIASRLHR